MTITLDVKAEDIFRTFSILLMAAIVVAIAYYARTAMSMLLVAGFLGLVISPTVTRLEAYLPFGKRKVAALLVFLLIGAVVGFVALMLVPLISEQSRELGVRIPLYLQELQARDEGFYLMGVDVPALFETAIAQAVATISFTADFTIAVASRLISNVFVFILTLLLAYSLVVEGPGLVNRADQLLPAKFRNRAETLATNMHRAITGFVGGQMIITSIASLVTFTLAILLGLPYPFSLAAVIWLTGLIPLIGNTLGAVVVVLVALSQSVLMAAGLAVFYVVYQQIENNVFEPYIQAHTVRLTPLYVLLSAVIGIHIAGFVGALLAIPAGACVRILIDDLIERINS